jgi:AcrR family transcriptional regulator
MKVGPGEVTRKKDKRHLMLKATERLMLEEGYAAVTYRRVAAKAGVSLSLVQYHFPSLDDLFTSVLRQGVDEVVERLAEMGAADLPLRAVWDFSTRKAGTALLMEFMALAHHRKSIRPVIAEVGEQMRRAEFEAISPKCEQYGLTDAGVSPRALLFLMAAVPRMLHLEEALGIVDGHRETMELVERLLDRVEPLPDADTGTAAAG